jgi:phosphoribosyl-ATP pyrophosphohydrolase
MHCSAAIRLVLMDFECYPVTDASLTPASPAEGTVGALWQTIQQRKLDRPQGSYTASLIEAGDSIILKKLGEEAVEVIVAASVETDDRVIYEMADLLYHALVLLAAHDLSWHDVEAELARRFK